MTRFTPEQLSRGLKAGYTPSLPTRSTNGMADFRQLDQASSKAKKSIPLLYNENVAAGNPAMPTLDKVLATIPTAIESVTQYAPEGLKNWANRASQSGGEVVTGVDNPDKINVGSGVGNTTADILGSIAGFASGGEGNVGLKLWQGAEKGIGLGLEKIAPKAPELAKTLLKTGGATIPYELNDAAANNRKISPKEAGTTAVANMALAALTHGVGKLGTLGKAKIEPEAEVKTETPAKSVIPRTGAKVEETTTINKPNFTVGPLGRTTIGETQAELPAGNTSLALNAGQKMGALTGQQPLMLPESKTPNWEYWQDRSTPTGNPPIALGPNYYVDQFGVTRTSPDVAAALPEGKAETPAIDLQGKNGNMTYPKQSILDAIIQRGDQASQNMADKNSAYSNPSALHAVARDPLDDFKDLALIGAGKLAKGVQDFTQWSKEMLAEHGEIIRKNLPYLWDRAADLYESGKTTVEYGGKSLSVKLGDTMGTQADKADTGNATVPKSTGKLPGGQAGGNTVKLPQSGEYVDTTPFDLKVLSDDKTTTKDMRYDYSGKLNAQKVRGTQLGDVIQKLAPDEQEAIMLNREAGGDNKILQSWLDNPDSKLDPYRGYIQQAMNLSPEAQKAKAILDDYYKQAGEHSKKLGTIKGVLEDYTNRIYKPEPPQDFVKTELGRSGLNSYTSHKKERVYANIIDAITGKAMNPDVPGEYIETKGKTPATLKASELMKIHNEEMARVNTNKAFADALTNKGLASWSDADHAPKGWSAVEGIRNGSQSLYMPPQIQKGLAAIIEPNFAKKIDILRKTQKFQGIVKTVDLSYSAFHHITMAAQMLYNSKGGLELAKNMPQVMDALKTDKFNEMEQDFARHGGMTSKIEANQDIIRKMSKGDDWVSKVARVPVIKQGLGLAEKNSEFLFGKMQRWLKVMDYQNKITGYIKNHSDLTDDQLVTAKRQIAREINAAYGGLNWQALGLTPSVQTLSRLMLLAPDWTFSNVELASRAFTKGPGGSAARGHLATALIGGAILTEGMNKLLTGHYTDQNAKGHETEVEVQPGVYFSFFRGGIGDILKVVSNVGESGPQGLFRFAQGKLAPIPRALVGAMGNTDYLGRKIVKTGDPIGTDILNFGKFAASNLAPMPFGINSTIKYVGDGRATPLGVISTAVGATRTGTTTSADPNNPLDNSSSKNSGNWLKDMTASKQEKAQIDLVNKITAENKTKLAQNTQMKQELGKALKTNPLNAGTAIFDKYNVPMSKRSAIRKEVQSQLKKSKLSPLAVKLGNMSAENRRKFVDSLPSDEQQIAKKALQEL